MMVGVVMVLVINMFLDIDLICRFRFRRVFWLIVISFSLMCVGLCMVLCSLNIVFGCCFNCVMLIVIGDVICCCVVGLCCLVIREILWCMLFRFMLCWVLVGVWFLCWVNGVSVLCSCECWLLCGVGGDCG